MTRNFILFCIIACATAMEAEPPSAREEEAQYVKALREAGFADLAIEYLKRGLSSKELTAEQRADLEFELASSLLSASEDLGDPSRREEMLEEARARLGEFSRNHPGHPNSSEARMQTAMIDLQQGRLRVAQAQSPANIGQSRELAEQARRFFTRAATDYEKAKVDFFAAYKKMPVYIPDETPRDRAERKKKTLLFDRYIESKFQTALARFYLADSYHSIELAPVDDKSPAATEEKRKWDEAYKKELEAARKGFEEIYNEHRRELVGLYAHLWLARCLAAQGDHRRAMGVFEQLMEHENRELAKFQREVFYFRLLSLAARGEHDQVIRQGEEWLKANAKLVREPTALGVQMEAAKAHKALGEKAKDERVRTRHYAEANRLFDRVASFPNEYTGLARREQLGLAPHLVGDIAARNPAQLYSLANAKLDSLKPTTPQDQRKKILSESIKLLEEAIAASSAGEETANDARLSLIYANLEAEEYYSAAVLAEFVSKEFVKSPAAPHSALLGVNAYASAYERSKQREGAGRDSFSGLDASRLKELNRHLRTKWPASREADDGRLIEARLDLSQRDFENAIVVLKEVDKKSPKALEADRLAGLASWDAYRVESRNPKPNRDRLLTLRREALQFLARASAATAATKAAWDRARFVNETLYAEALFESGEDEKALATLAPLLEAIQTNSLPPEIEPALQSSAMTTALQASIRRSKLEDADRLMELMAGKDGNSAAVTGVFLSLAARLKEQIARLKSAGEEDKRKALTEAFEKFLDRVAARESGHSIQSLVFVGDNYLELGKPEKAAPLLNRATGHPDASQDANQAMVNRARLLTARCRRLSGDFDAARKEIDSLLKENMNAKDVIMERGAVLESAGDWKGAIAHWKWLVKRTSQTRPRPPEFYEGMDRLLADFLKVTGEDRSKRIEEGLGYAKFVLSNDPSLTPAWRQVFEAHLDHLQSARGQ